MDIQITQETQNGVEVFRVEGRLDATSAPILEQKISSVVQAQGSKLLLNMQGVDYLSSAGMRVMLSAVKKLASSKGRVAFSGLNESLMETVKMAGFEKILPIFPTESAALANLSA